MGHAIQSYNNLSTFERNTTVSSNMNLEDISDQSFM